MLIDDLNIDFVRLMFATSPQLTDYRASGRYSSFWLYLRPLPLISLLSSSDQVLQEHAVTAILNLSLLDENKSLIAASGAIKPLIQTLKSGTSTAKKTLPATTSSNGIWQYGDCPSDDEEDVAPAGKGKSGISQGVLAMAADNSRPLTGVVFEPFKELNLSRDLDLVPASSNASIVRQKFDDDCEAAINEQINVEYNVSYVYHAIYAYFDRENVALKGLAKFFKGVSEEEREHAEKLMEYQTLILGNRETIDDMSTTSASVLTTILKLIDNYDLYGRVAYPKHHKQSDVPDIYRLAAKTMGVFINPAFIEPFGLTLIEDLLLIAMHLKC